MKKLIGIGIALSLLHFGCNQEADKPDFVQYNFSDGNQSNYTKDLSADQISQDLKSIKTIFTHVNMEDQMIIPLAKKSSSLAKKKVEDECVDMNEMMQQEMTGEDFVEATISWTMSDGKPLVVCANDMNPYSKMDGSLLAMSLSGDDGEVDMKLKMNMLLNIIQANGQMQGMKMTLSALMSATIADAFNLEALMSGTITMSDFMTGYPAMTGDVSMEFSLLDGSYRCKTTMDMSVTSDSDGPQIESCEITHNGKKVGTLDLTTEPPVILDVNGAPIQ